MAGLPSPARSAWRPRVGAYRPATAVLPWSRPPGQDPMPDQKGPPMLVTLVIVAAGMVLAFWAGGRWRHHARARSDYKTTAASLTGLRRLRRATFRAALVA